MSSLLPKRLNSSLSMPTPINISYMWNFGSLLGLVLALQIVSGLLVAMRYSPHTAFDFVSTIDRTPGSGWSDRSNHAIGASFFFFCLVIHMARGLYYGSAKSAPLVWISGILIYLLTMGVAFLGYVLVWGNMSFWGATVITSMASTAPYLGGPGSEWMWGSWAVDDITVNRFYTFHFALPFLILALALVHILALHNPGSSNPSGVQKKHAGFHPFFSLKDLIGFIALAMAFLAFNYINPTTLLDPENFMVQGEGTPEHIQPEWYFLWAYAMLRSVPNKLVGVCILITAICFLFFPSFMWPRSARECIFTRVFFYMLVSTLILLTWIGACPVEYPYIFIGQSATLMFFILLLLMISPPRKYKKIFFFLKK